MGILGRSPRHSNHDYEELDPEINAEINITPLTDVFLVLLIIFMVTSSALTQMGVNVTLPKAKQASNVQAKPGIIITVTKEEQIQVNTVRVPLDQLASTLKPMLDKSEEKAVILEGDKTAVLGLVVKIMDESKKAGATKFSVATQAGE